MALAPRVVLVTRKTPWRLLLEQHGTEAQARWILGQRGQSVDELLALHAQTEAAVHRVSASIPLAWRRATLDRAELDRFPFEPEDVVVVVGQDGLVANVAKYLEGQPVVGVNPLPERFPGVLVRHVADVGAHLMVLAGERALREVEDRALVEARLDDGQVLRGLNEVFVGHRSHQSARYVLHAKGGSEHHSSSGVLVATGTGSTGWAKSLARQRLGAPQLPDACEDWLAWLVREAWPSPFTGCAHTDGTLEPGESLRLTSELESGGVVFADGIEADHLPFDHGRTVSIGVADQRLRLVLG
ncbi:MAG: hypothetical protein EP330_20130 [Deltaproteobacteria bacterium]|nr:MAG: hypothetical protein EP330_20130 [Deltaproteobacteria bacterium]